LRREGATTSKAAAIFLRPPLILEERTNPLALESRIQIVHEDGLDTDELGAAIGNAPYPSLSGPTLPTRFGAFVLVSEKHHGSSHRRLIHSGAAVLVECFTLRVSFPAPLHRLRRADG
jgi:hypothetical protein